MAKAASRPPRVRLIHWNQAEARGRIAALKELGYRVEHFLPLEKEALRKLGEAPPAAVVVDLSRLPSQGRDVALAIRQRRATREVPLLFVEGEPEKVERIRRILPDATFIRWVSAGSALREAIASPPRDPVKPASILQGYSGTPLPKKLGIKPGMQVGTEQAPKNLQAILGDLPDGVELKEGESGAVLVLWFIRSRRELRSRIRSIAARLKGSVWMIWPKKTSPLASDLTQQDIREAGLAHQLVDYKICAVDADWSGLLFTRRRQGKS